MALVSTTPTPTTVCYVRACAENLFWTRIRAERATPQPSTQTAKLKSSAMDLGPVLLTLVAGFILVFLYWLYSFAVAPFRVLSRLGIPGPPPVPFYGNQKMVVKFGRLNFFTKMFEKYGNVFG